MEKKLSFLDDPCNHPPYYVPQYKRNSNEKLGYKQMNIKSKTYIRNCEGGAKFGEHTLKSNQNFKISNWKRESSGSNANPTFIPSKNQYSQGNCTYQKHTYTEHGQIPGKETRKSRTNPSVRHGSKQKSTANRKLGARKSKMNRRGMLNSKGVKDRLGFHQVKVPLDTSLNQVVTEYAIPLARKLNHNDVYISTKFRCS